MKMMTAKFFGIFISVLALLAACSPLSTGDVPQGYAKVRVAAPSGRAITDDERQNSRLEYYFNDRKSESNETVAQVGSVLRIKVVAIDARNGRQVATAEKTITVASGTNNVSVLLYEDRGADATPPAPSSPAIEYVSVTFNQGFVYTNSVNGNSWQDMTGASLPGGGQREKNSGVPQSDEPRASGYVFKGWVADSQSPSGDAPDAQNFNYVHTYTDDAELYAIWEQLEPGSHEVKFETGAGSDSVSGMPNNAQKQSTTQVTFTETPTRAGYNFTGWSANVSGVNVTQQGSNWTFTMPDSDVTLTAQWQIKTYSVTYNTGDPNLSIPQHTRTYGQSFTLNPTSVSMTRTGYSFANWTWQKAGSSNPITVTGGSSTSEMQNYEGNIEFTAQWTPNTYNITYYDVDASSTSTAFSGEQSGLPQTHTYGSATNLANPTTARKGFTFEGWYTDNGGNTSAGNSLGAATYTNEIKLYAKWTIEMVPVTGGTPFTMGDGSRSDNAAWSGVTVSNFKMGKYEVTQAQWKTVMGSLPSSMATASGDAGNNPVNYVSWYDALVFCNKLSMLEGKQPCYSISGSTDPANWGTVPTSTNATWDAVVCDWTADGYRLPTEAEWEYAARGGAGQMHGKYSGIDSATTPSPTEDDLKTVAWYTENAGSKSHEVGTTPVKENALGISDMSGNVYEWCWDWYNGSGYASANGNTTSDPRGAATGASRVRRGGSWFNSASDCAVAYRINSNSYYRYDYFGFRLVCRQ